MATGPRIEYEVAERPISLILGGLVLTIAIIAVGVVPIFVGITSERRDPGGGYIILGAITGIGHVMVGLLMFLEVLFIVGTGRGKTITRIARNVRMISFSPTMDFVIGLFGVGFGTVYMFAFTQTIADLPRLPQYAIGYTLDGWVGIWVVWFSVLAGAFFWALWLDALLGRDPVARVITSDDEEEEE